MGNAVLFERIVALEWEMFSQVHNAGGKAQCQTDRQSFEIMRKSQAMSLSDRILESWLNDLEEARRQGHNLMTEKYAWMMESTAPEDFAKILPLLPHLEEGTLRAIEEIVAAHVQWKEVMEQEYPLLAGRGRPLRTAQDSSWGTSFETYLRCELKTCSARTIECWLELVREQKQVGINAAELTLLHQAQGFGYKSLEEAELSLRRREGESGRRIF